MARKAGTYRTAYGGITEFQIAEFARRLNELMLAKGWNQTDLAKKAFGVDPDTGVPLARDRISIYLRGKGLPDQKKMAQLAKAFNMPVEKLAPDMTKAPVDRNVEPMSVQESNGTVRVRMDRLLTPEGYDQLHALMSTLRQKGCILE